MADERRSFFGGALRRLKGLFDEVRGELAEPEEPRFVPPAPRPVVPSRPSDPASRVTPQSAPRDVSQAAASGDPGAALADAAAPPVRVAKVSARLCLNGNILVELVEPATATGAPDVTADGAIDPGRAGAGAQPEVSDDDDDVEVCERCLAWCPVPGALTIVPESGSVVPRVDASLCTGCGECVSHCAAYPGALGLVAR